MSPKPSDVVDAQPRPQVVGPEPRVGVVVDAAAQLADRAARRASGPPPALCPPNRSGAAARTTRARRACRRTGCCGTSRAPCRRRSTARWPGRWKASTSFEATMPMTPRCQPSPATTSTVRAPTSGSCLDELPRLGDDRRLFLLAARVLRVQLLGQRRAPRRPSPRRSPAAGAWRCRACSSGRRRSRAARSRSRCGSCRSSCPRGPQASSSARRPTLCGPRRQQVEAELGDDAVLAHERHDVGQRADARRS